MRKLRQYQRVQLKMITRFRNRNGGIEVRRFRMDALLITATGAAGGGFLLFQVASGGINAVIAILPVLLALVATLTGLDTLRKRGREVVTVDLEKKLLTAKRGRGRQGTVPFSEIGALDISRGSFLNLNIVQGKHEYALFESFLFSPRIYRFCALLRDAGVPVSPQLDARLSTRGRTWKMALVMILFLWLAGTVTWLVMRG